MWNTGGVNANMLFMWRRVSMEIRYGGSSTGTHLLEEIPRQA